MRTLKTSLHFAMAGLVIVAILIILEESGYGYFGLIDAIKEILDF